MKTTSTESLTHLEVIQSIEPFVDEHLDSLLKPVEKSWQPTHWLPDLVAEDWREQLGELRARARDLSDEVFVILVGDMITEEALPSYQTLMSSLSSLFAPTARATRVDGAGIDGNIRVLI